MTQPVYEEPHNGATDEEPRAKHGAEEDDVYER
jgi:hypothetical protein